MKLHPPSQSAKNVFARRMKQKRVERGLSQKQLGIAAGLDVGVASARINRYETGVHAPDYLTALRIAEALGTALPSLYTDDDRLLQVIDGYTMADAQTQKMVESLLQPFAPPKLQAAGKV
jgi:transcriptional regulator with XRE-family HTH domain